MNKISEVLTDDIKRVAIAGHVNPDGDCVGSCMGLYLYLTEQYPQIQTTVYVESVKPEFHYIKGIDQVKNTCDESEIFDLFIALDVSTKDRIGVALPVFDQAKKTVCIDHHVSNLGFAMVNHIVPQASSASEVLYELLEDEKVSKSVAEAIYTGIIHDCGVFQYSCTGPRTMEVAAQLLRKGIDAARIIDESFNQKTYVQQQILGRTLLESIRCLDGRCIVGIVTAREMDFYGVNKQDLDGIVSQLRNTSGVEVAMLIYETGAQEYKVSLRSNFYVDVNSIAQEFGGGGHLRAAGCTMHGNAYDVINNLTLHIEKAMESAND